MPDLPHHPDAHDDPGPDDDVRPGNRWVVYVIAVVIGLAFVAMVIAHLTGVVGPESH
jgi:hypothetical protein